jgi:phage shock protein C
MYCTGCGKAMNEGDKYCPQCGRANVPGPGECGSPLPPRPRLMRSMRDKKIAGVCSGVARHFGWDVTLVRVFFLAAIVIKGLGLLAYVIAWIAMPRDDEQVVAAR